jgi:amino acid adenylation domain-containing protein
MTKDGSSPTTAERAETRDQNESPVARAVAAQVAARGPRTAIRDSGESLTYRALDAAADHLAARMRCAGIGPGTLSAVRLVRGLRSYIAMLAVLKTGGTYLPLDPLDTSDRSDFILTDSGAAWLVSDDLGAPYGIGVRQISDPLATLALPPDTAYVIYTSGSTGLPKGVPVTGRSVLEMLAAAGREFELSAADTWSQYHALSFDFSIWELWGALTTGATVAVVPPAVVRHPYDFARFLADERVSLLSQVPTAFDALARALRRSPRALPDLRYVVLGGEPVRPESLGVWRLAAAAPDARLINMYGITETTVHVTHADITHFDTIRTQEGATFIGSPLSHLEMTAADPETLEYAAPGLVGELLITGPSLARGYLRRPELTTQRFIRLPGDPANRTWYRSGDLGYRDDVGWWHCGRADDQVKVKGVRIELGEVETVLRRCPLVEDCIVVAPPLGNGGHCLVAAYVASDDGADAEESAPLIRAFLSERLPAYLVPTSVFPVERLPLSNGGKLDRRAIERLWLAGGTASGERAS